MVNSEQLFKNTSFYNKCWVCCNRSCGGRWLACWAAWPAAAWSHPKYSPTGLAQNLSECFFVWELCLSRSGHPSFSEFIGCWTQHEHTPAPAHNMNFLQTKHSQDELPVDQEFLTQIPALHLGLNSRSCLSWSEQNQRKDKLFNMLVRRCWTNCVCLLQCYLA